jgi:hypothetical protein
MKATLVAKNDLGLEEVLARMRMTLANYAESTILSYGRSRSLS